MVDFADDLTNAGRLSKFDSRWKIHLDVDPKYSYFSKPSKTILIVRPEYDSKAVEAFDSTNIKITSGQRHIIAITGSELYQKEYMEEIFSQWRDVLLLFLSNVAEIQPPAAPLEELQ